MSVKSTSRTQFGSPNKKPRERAAHGRHCEAPGCATILSTYNTSTRCWLHTTSTTKHPLVRDR